MELIEALRTTGSIRRFSSRPVADSLLAQLLDHARFAPSGGNRQAWHVIVVADAEQRRAVRDLYLTAWYEYTAHLLAGLVPFSPLASDADRRAASEQHAAAVALSTPDSFAESLDTVPVMLVVCANVAVLAATDRDLERYHLVGGASIYPFVWNIVLAAREYGLGGVMTTVATRNEIALREVLAIPEPYAVASVVALGYPLQRHTRLTRAGVADFTTIDTFDGPAFTATPGT